jgi:acetyl/propionyl-CoA carboxylase alpha subunit
VPGYDGEAQDDATLAREAGGIGYPLLVKPSAGGGGKGMRIVRNPDGLADDLAAARREAHRSFGDDRLILERLLAGARHVEVQVLFDRHGAGVHLGERDCSAQRRNQKIVEEAPAPSVTPELRARMGDAALRVAAAVGYQSAGTVEMLLTDAGEFHFLEMNTRLQVEHPVTEAVTGRDLVAMQLEIAGGEPLGIAQADVAIAGHAVECRLTAEDASNGFRPSPGTLTRFDVPDVADLRVDTHCEPGTLIPPHYDSLMAKLIGHGADREEAVDVVRAALDGLRVEGVETNRALLASVLDHEDFVRGAVTTRWLEEAAFA